MKYFTQLGFIVLLMAMMVILPVAAATDISTSVVMAKGGGAPPVVLAKWETEPFDNSLESGDPTHITAGSQFLAPGVFNGEKIIDYYAIVTDEENNGNVLGTYADIFHPDGTFKYQVHMLELSQSEGIAAYNAVKDLSLIKTPCTCNGEILVKTIDTDCEDLLTQLQKGTASVWKGRKAIHYCQMDGNYLVKVRAVDQNQNPSEFLDNTFFYVPLTAAEYDFTGVSYGSVSMGPLNKPVWRSGDTNFLTDDGKPTVRNVGNTRAKIQIIQDDMGFDKNAEGVWNVQYDARLGHVSAEPLYDPFTLYTLIDVLPRSHTDEMDFSIHVIKGFDAGQGSMTLSVINADTPPTAASVCLTND